MLKSKGFEWNIQKVEQVLHLVMEMGTWMEQPHIRDKIFLMMQKKRSV